MTPHAISKWIAGLSLFLTILAFSAPTEGDLGPCFKITFLSLKDEFVEIVNKCPTWADIGNWFLLSVDENGSPDQIFRFPPVCVVAPGTRLIVHSGGDSWNLANRNDLCWFYPPAQEDIDLYWDVSGPDAAVWRDKGDTACLLTPTGQLVSQYQSKIPKSTRECWNQY